MIMSTTFLWLLRDFVSDYHHAKFGCNWMTNKGEKGGDQGAHQPICMVPKDPSLNRVKDAKFDYDQLKEENVIRN